MGGSLQRTGDAMTAVLTTHRCPKCGSDVQVYAREATVWHACGKAPVNAKMVRPVVEGTT